MEIVAIVYLSTYTISVSERKEIKMIKEIRTEVEFINPDAPWAEQVYKVIGFYKDVKVIEREYAAKQGSKVCSAAVFVTKVRDEINKEYYKKGR